MSEQERVSEWMRSNAVPLVVAEDGTFDVPGFREVVGSARLVGIGGATLGTHEFDVMRQKLIEILVDEAGFDTVAVETNWPEVELVDNYVSRGEGTAAEALRGVHGWHFWSEEAVALVDSLRQRAAHGRAVAVRGAQISEPHMAADRVVEFLRSVDMDAAEFAAAAYAREFETWPRHEHPTEDSQRSALAAWRAYLAKPRSGRDEVSRLIREVHQRLARDEARFAGTVHAEAYRKAVVYADTVVVADGYRRREAERARPAGALGRMRRAVRTALDRWSGEAEPGDADVAAKVVSMLSGEQRAVFLSHIAHVASVRPHVGWHLQNRLGERYLRVGMIAAGGSFHAKAAPADADGAPGPIEAFSIPAPLPGSMEAAIAGVGIPAFMVDLRRPARGVVKDWLETPRPTFMAGFWANRERLSESFGVARPRDAFDIIFGFADTRPSHPLS